MLSSNPVITVVHMLIWPFVSHNYRHYKFPKQWPYKRKFVVQYFIKYHTMKASGGGLPPRILNLCTHGLHGSAALSTEKKVTTLPHTFMACCLLKYRHNRTFKGGVTDSNALDRKPDRPRCGGAKSRTSHCVPVYVQHGQIYSSISIYVPY